MIEQEEMRTLKGKAHKITIEEKQKIMITGVEDVDSFNENEVIFLTSKGMITVMGEDLHIAKLNLEEGVLMVEGEIDGLDYSDHEALRAKKQGGIISRIFK